MELTKAQQKNIRILESVEDFKIWKHNKSYLKQANKETDAIFNTYYNLDGDIYYVRAYYYKFHANNNIITCDYPYKKEVFKINNETYLNRI